MEQISPNGKIMHDKPAMIFYSLICFVLVRDTCMILLFSRDTFFIQFESLWTEKKAKPYQHWTETNPINLVLPLKNIICKKETNDFRSRGQTNSLKNACNTNMYKTRWLRSWKGNEKSNAWMILPVSYTVIGLQTSLQAFTKKQTGLWMWYFHVFLIHWF